MRDDRDTSMLMPFLAGLAAGAVLGLLFAPRSGKHTRRKVREKLVDLREQATDLMDDGRAAMGAAREKVAERKQAKRDDLDDVARFLMEEGMHLWERVTTAPTTNPTPS
jgi:gas vesicle protein